MTISEVLSSVVDWERLAGWLELPNGPIQVECQSKPNGAKHNCYRSSLVRRFCVKFPSGSPKEVAERIAQVLEERMDHKWQAQQLRELRFSEYSVARDNYVFPLSSSDIFN